MNASWSMVLGALLAGTVGGFMIPVRPEIRDVPALTASKATEPAEKLAADKAADTPTTAKTENASGVRKISLTEAASRSAEPNTQAELNRQADANSCAKETWPYRSPSCLDRTAKVAPADTVVAARPVDPTVSLQDELKTETASKPEAATAKPEAEKSQQKTASTPSASEERAERSAPQPEQASADADEPRAQTANQRPKKSAKKPRRSTRRVNRDPVDLDDGIPTRIYLRGPDGRLYLAPEYRPSGRTVYYMR